MRNTMGQPIRSKEDVEREERWRAEEDMKALHTAEEIKKDKKRMERVERLHKEHEEALARHEERTEKKEKRERH